MKPRTHDGRLLFAACGLSLLALVARGERLAHTGLALQVREAGGRPVASFGHASPDAFRINALLAREPRRLRAEWTGYWDVPAPGLEEMILESDGVASVRLGDAEVAGGGRQRVRHRVPPGPTRLSIVCEPSVPEPGARAASCSSRGRPRMGERSRLCVLLLAGPFMAACALGYGDPFHAINAHAAFYSRRAGFASVPNMSRLFSTLFSPWEFLETGLTGLTSHPFDNKWSGLGALIPGLDLAARALSLAGLVLLLWRVEGVFTILVFLCAIAPSAWTWNIPGGDEWRFTLPVYRLLLITAAVALEGAIRGRSMPPRSPCSGCASSPSRSADRPARLTVPHQGRTSMFAPPASPRSGGSRCRLSYLDRVRDTASTHPE